MTWATLFERAGEYEVTVEDARAAVVAVREERTADGTADEGDG